MMIHTRVQAIWKRFCSWQHIGNRNVLCCLSIVIQMWSISWCLSGQVETAGIRHVEGIAAAQACTRMSVQSGHNNKNQCLNTPSVAEMHRSHAATFNSLYTCSAYAKWMIERASEPAHIHCQPCLLKK